MHQLTENRALPGVTNYVTVVIAVLVEIAVIKRTWGRYCTFRLGVLSSTPCHAILIVRNKCGRCQSGIGICRPDTGEFVCIKCNSSGDVDAANGTTIIRGRERGEANVYAWGNAACISDRNT